jgi:hypothetical protein
MLPRPVFFSSSEDEPFRPVFGEILRLVGYLLILKDNLQKASRLSGVLTPASFTLDVRGASARSRQSAAADSERKPFCRLAIPKKGQDSPFSDSGYEIPS